MHPVYLLSCVSLVYLASGWPWDLTISIDFMLKSESFVGVLSIKGEYPCSDLIVCSPVCIFTTLLYRYVATDRNKFNSFCVGETCRCLGAVVFWTGSIFDRSSGLNIFVKFTSFDRRTLHLAASPYLLTFFLLSY